MSKTGFEKSLEGEQKWPPAKAKVVRIDVEDMCKDTAAEVVRVKHLDPLLVEAIKEVC